MDIDAREALVSALNAYEGAVVLISHDPHLIELAADRLWLVHDGVVQPYDGDLNDYRKLLLDRSREARREGREINRNKKEDRKAAAEQRAQIAPLRKAVQQADRKLENLNTQKATLAAKLADPKFYEGPAAQVTTLQKELGELEKSIAAAEDVWMAAHEALDAAEKA